MAKKHVECLECGTMHYIINREEADSLEADGLTGDEFLARNPAFCSHCGERSKFSSVTEEYVDTFAPGGSIPPIFLDDGELKSAKSSS